MPGQAHMRRRRLPALALILLAPLAIPAIGGADPTQSASALRQLDAQLVAKQRSAVLELYSLDQRLATNGARLDQLRAQAVQLRAEQSQLRLELRLARGDSRVAQRQLDQQLNLLYEQGTVSPLEVVLGARSLDQALTELDNLSAASTDQEAIVAQVKQARVRLAAVGSALASRARALAASTRAVEATRSGLAAAQVQRSSYIASLATRRRLTETQIARLTAEARAATIRAAALQRVSNDSAPVVQALDTAPTPTAATPTAVTPTPVTPTADPAVAAPAAPAAPPAPLPAGARTLTVVATGYALGGTTATGLPVGWGVAAVDPSVIPLGTHMTVPGYGEAVAADTGGAIAGDTIDLWFPTAGQAQAWGRRTVTVVLH